MTTQNDWQIPKERWIQTKQQWQINDKCISKWNNCNQIKSFHHPKLLYTYETGDKTNITMTHKDHQKQVSAFPELK